MRFLLLIALLVPALAVSAAGELTVVSWGGAYTRSQILGFIRAYERETGVDVEVLDYDGDLEEIRAQVRAWNTRWQVVDMELDSALRACREGLLEEFDPAGLPPAPDGTPAHEDFLPGALPRCGVGNVVSSLVVTWDRATTEAPQRLEDFFDLERLPGGRGLRRSPKGTLEWALLADGVEPARVYEVLATPEGQDRAFARLDSIRSAIVWWTSGAEAIRLLEQDRVVMSAVFNGRVQDARARGEPLGILWDHAITFFDVWVVPKHGGDPALARDFVRFATSTQALADQARYIPYGPARRSSMALIDPQRRDLLPTAERNLETALEENPEFWAEHFDPLSQRFARWLERDRMVPRDMPR